MTGGFSINITSEGIESTYELCEVTYVEKLMLLDVVRRGLGLDVEDIHKFKTLLDAGAFEDCFEEAQVNEN